jgi:hypothetical protein
MAVIGHQLIAEELDIVWRVNQLDYGHKLQNETMASTQPHVGTPMTPSWWSVLVGTCERLTLSLRKWGRAGCTRNMRDGLFPQNKRELQ